MKNKYIVRWLDCGEMVTRLVICALDAKQALALAFDQLVLDCNLYNGDLRDATLIASCRLTGEEKRICFE